MKTSKPFQTINYLRFLVLLGLGAMMLLFLGCGSGSAPQGKKPEKIAKSSRATTSTAAMPLSATEEIGAGKIKKATEGQRLEVVPGFTQEELDARQAESRKKYEQYIANMEVAPGLTQSELEARQAQQRKAYEEYRANMEVAPGLTQRELEARLAESQKKFAASDVEVVPGLTQEQLNAKMRQQVRPEAREMLPPSAGK